MQLNHWSRLRVVLVTAIVSGMLILGQPRRADAYYGLAVGLALVLYVPYISVMTVICTPVAAFKPSAYPGGFSAAFEDCLRLELKEQHPLLTEDNQSGRAEETEVDESKDRFGD